MILIVNGFFIVPSCTGNQCDVTNCTSNPCKNASQCVDHTNGFSCVCKPGQTGKLCDVEYNECDSTPCQNGGTCAEGVNRFTCTCARGFTGVTCEKRTGDCTDPPSVANGKVRSTKSYALYTCNNGYKTIGLRFIRCNGGKWIGKPPTCQASEYQTNYIHESLHDDFPVIMQITHVVSQGDYRNLFCFPLEIIKTNNGRYRKFNLWL